jgi:hypothetical protein
MKTVLKFGILDHELLRKIWRKYGRDFGSEIHQTLIERVSDCDCIYQDYLLKNKDLSCIVKVKNESE